MLKSGNIENLKMLMDDPQVIAADFKLSVENLRYAAFSGDIEIVRFVLQSECFGIDNPDGGLSDRDGSGLTEQQHEAILEALSPATTKCACDCVKLLLKQLTPSREDGTFEPFLISDDTRTEIYNRTEDGLDREDNPELFEVLWDTTLHKTPSQESIDRRIGLPPQECLNRRLISTAAMGCVKTVRLLVDKYKVDVNHISHKFFSTPLGRAAGSGANPLPGRLEVVEYLCSRPELNMELANGEYCNGETALAQAVLEASINPSRKPELADMVRLLLKLGGPVDEISSELRERVDSAESSDTIQVRVLWAREERRKPVVLASESREGFVGAVLEYSVRDLRHVLRNLKIRSDDETLQKEDPRERPLMPRSGEQLDEDERAKPTLLQDDKVSADE